MKRKTLTAKEKLFCCMYISCGNAGEAALRAGYKKRPELQGAELMTRKDILRQIARLREAAPQPGAEAGFARLAYGRINDAVKLISGNLCGEDIDALDLYGISEIKKPKDGCIEIKFFDRQKALEKLYLINEARTAGEDDSFYRALEDSAGAPLPEDVR